MNESKEKKFKKNVNKLSTFVFILAIILFVIEVTNVPYGYVFTNILHPIILLVINVILVCKIVTFHDKSTNQEKSIFKRYKESVKFFKAINFDKLFEMMLINVLTGFLILQKDKVKTLTGYYPIFWGIFILIFVVLNVFALYIIKNSKLRKNRPEYYFDYGLALFYSLVNSVLLFLLMFIPHMLRIMLIIDVLYMIVFIRVFAVGACKNNKKKN